MRYWMDWNGDSDYNCTIIIEIQINKKNNKL
jgi:hypothetical protein